MKLTKEQIAEIQADIHEAKKTVKDDASLSKLIGAFDEHVTALLSHIADQDKELAEREVDMRSFNEAVKFSTELIASLTKEREEAMLACAAKDEALKFLLDTFGNGDSEDAKTVAQFCNKALSPTIGQELMKELVNLRGWKREMLQVESQWDVQQVAAEIGLRPGTDIRKQILPAIKKYRATLLAIYNTGGNGYPAALMRSMAQKSLNLKEPNP